MSGPIILALWICGRAGALSISSAVEVEEGHGDIVSNLEHAVGLMEEGIGHFLVDHKHHPRSPEHTAHAELGAAIDFVGRMSMDVKTLRKALRKFGRQRERDELVTKRMEEELLAAEQQVKLLQAGKLQAEEQARKHSTSSQDCEDELKGVPAGINQLSQVQAANNDLQQKIEDLEDANQQLQGQVIMLSTKAREADMLRGKVNVLQAYEERLAHSMKQSVQQEVHKEESRLEDKLSYTVEVAKDLQKQDVELQKGGIALSNIVKKLRKQNEALRADKGHLLESMQSMLQQSNNCQQQLQLCSPNGASSMQAVPAEVFEVAGGPVFSEKDIIAAASADVTTPIVLPKLGNYKLSKSLLRAKTKRSKRKLQHGKAHKVTVRHAVPKPVDPDSVSILDDLSLPLAPEGLGPLS